METSEVDWDAREGNFVKDREANERIDKERGNAQSAHLVGNEITRRRLSDEERAAIASYDPAEDPKSIYYKGEKSSLPTPPTIGEPPKAPTNNSQFQWRKYQQRLAAWQVEKKAQVEQYELERSAAMDQKRATIQGRQFEIQEADRIAEIEAADLASTLKERTEGEVLGALQAIRGIDGKSPDFQDRISEIMLEYPNGITDPRVKTIIDFHSKTNQAVAAARKAEEEKGVSLTETASKEVLEARKVAAAEGFTPEEVKEVFRDGGVDQVALARAQRAAKDRASRQGKAETDQSRQDYSLSRLEEDKAALEAQAAINPEDPKIQADIAAIDERIRFRKERQEEADVAPTSSEAISVDEAKRLQAQGELAPGTLIKMNDGTIRPYVGK